MSETPKIERNHKGQWTFYPARPQHDRNLNRYHPLWTAMWRGNIDLSPVLGKHAAINYIGKYAAKSENISNSLDKTILDLTHNQPMTDGIGPIIAKTLNRFCIERDFSAQEACHQLLQLQMVECSRVFVIISLPKDLSVNRILNPRSRRRTQTAQRQQLNDPPEGPKKSLLECYMERPPEYEDVSYYDIIKSYQWRPRKKEWAKRHVDAIVQIFPHKWQHGLKPDPSKPENGQCTSTFATAARQALMLYIPFRNLRQLVTHHSEAIPEVPPLPFNPAENNDIHWKLSFLIYMNEPTRDRFPLALFRLFHNITEPDFDLIIDPTNNSDNEWDPTPELQRRQEQEWERMARLPQNAQRQMGQPREFFGYRQIDTLHDWNTDLQPYELADNLDTFIATHKQLDNEVREHPVVHPEMLNEGQRQVYNYIVDGFINADHQQFNTVVMGIAGVGKSFLIRALEHGLWQTAQRKFGERDYPTVRSIVRLAAFTGLKY